MNRNLLRYCMLLPCFLALSLLVAGCPAEQTPSGTTGTDDDGTTTDSLTSTEQDAVQAGLDAGTALTTSFQATQSPMSTEEDDQSSFALPDEIPVGSVEYNFGTCPNVDLAANNEGVLYFDITIDFGTTGCNPIWDTEHTYAGSASGTFSQAQQEIDLTFTDYSIDDYTIDGSIEAEYDRTTTEVSLEGAWDITTTADGVQLDTSGNGSGTYDTENYVTTITTFTGSVTDDVFDFTVSMTGVKMSFATYDRFMPYAGTLQLAGQDIRTISVRFDEDSPTTGVVEVSIGGSPYVEYNVYEAAQGS